MFCTSCGQQLPDDAKFCVNCGTPQEAVSVTETHQNQTENQDDMNSCVPAMCPKCNAHMNVYTFFQVARCGNCGTECFVQDAINALTGRSNNQVGNATSYVSGINTDSLLQSVEIMLGNSDFSGAMLICNTILNSDPTNGKVYLYMLMSDLHCRNRNELAIASQTKPFDGNQYYIKAMQYGRPELKNELQSYRNRAYTRNAAHFMNPTVGAEISFGHDPIGQSVIWKILRIQNNMLFIISRDNICEMPYHEPGGSITWADCTLRKWLNNGFINEFFTTVEQARILPCKNRNDNNDKIPSFVFGNRTCFNTPGGVPTTDKVFLLSIDEAEFLFANNQERSNGSYWWLRSPGETSGDAATVGDDGDIGPGNLGGYFVYGSSGVRPAMWIKLEQSIFFTTIRLRAI